MYYGCRHVSSGDLYCRPPSPPTLKTKSDSPWWRFVDDEVAPIIVGFIDWRIGTDGYVGKYLNIVSSPIEGDNIQLWNEFKC